MLGRHLLAELEAYLPTWELGVSRDQIVQSIWPRPDVDTQKGVFKLFQPLVSLGRASGWRSSKRSEHRVQPCHGSGPCY